MSRTSRRDISGFAAATATVLAVAAMATSLASACGGDNQGTPSTDAAPDRTADVGSDGGGPPDGGEAGADAGDAQGDTGNVADVVVVDVVFGDGPQTVQVGAFISAQAQAFCSRFEFCCLEDASTFDTKFCVAQWFTSGGFGGALTGLETAGVVDGGNIALDQAVAIDCLNALSNVPCGVVQSTTYSALWAKCFAAVKGTLAVNAGCRASIECAPPAFCTPPVVDGGLGTCTPPSPTSGSCNDFPKYSNQQECSYLGVGTPGNHCNEFSGASSTWTCQPPESLGQSCVFHQECESGVCGDQGKCDTKFTISDPGVPGGNCDFYTIHDAGGGG